MANLKKGDLCPGCKEARLDDWFVKKGRCGWCGYDPKTGEQACLVPASTPEPKP